MEIEYSRLFARVKAAIIDGVVLVLIMLVIAKTLALYDTIPNDLGMYAFFAVFFYDPLFTSVFGGTIGHMISGIRVKREKNVNKNIIFPLALIRFIIKVALGWISLLTVSRHRKKQAIHDLIVRSVVSYS